ncbi:biliverdin-producing heme oxygenase [Donghicola sp. C2-DW-16]|uniref:Biliverdin-producing heme oxygenase n=1 Tax=Donghicola mangrovi TaxID=2729614 RepID=A0ABX2PL34_9RHOB|nr:hypothetical protein [Donghicola mangrovi]NVO29209.1 biliverdin-producing heme oxygenase [Donghicola mangrovi]
MNQNPNWQQARQSAQSVAPNNLLARLRADTRGAHEALDQAFAPFQADPAAHLRSFLAAQMAGLTALSSSARLPHNTASLSLLSEMLDRLAQDCQQMAIPVPVVRPRSGLHPLAVAYLVIGSRLGTEVLRRTLVASGTERIPLYFAPQDYKAAWQGLCAELSAQSAAGPLADDVCDGVIAGFELFHSAARLTRETTGKLT